jgi:hypothetical protein
MKIFRLQPDESRFCHDCHNKAELEVDFGSKRPAVRLCAHDAGYLARVIGLRLGEIQSGAPIPKSRDEDSKGNR